MVFRLKIVNSYEPGAVTALAQPGVFQTIRCEPNPVVSGFGAGSPTLATGT